jgi:zinc transporter
VAKGTARIVEELDASYDRLGVLQDHLDGQIAERQNAASYVLSVVAAIFLPLGFLTGLFGVNVGGMPGMNSSIAFAILCISMVAIGALLWYLFRRIKWL